MNHYRFTVILRGFFVTTRCYAQLEKGFQAYDGSVATTIGRPFQWLDEDTLQKWYIESEDRDVFGIIFSSFHISSFVPCISLSIYLYFVCDIQHKIVQCRYLAQLSTNGFLTEPCTNIGWTIQLILSASTAGRWDPGIQEFWKLRLFLKRHKVPGDFWGSQGFF